MKRILLILLSCIACLGVQAQQLDSLTKAGLSDKLDEYFEAIKTLGVDAQKEEVDFLIETATDSLVRQFVAVKVYDHYLSSPVMGAEAVAIHVLDKWFLDGSVKMYDDVDLLHARIFADFNRQSLIGEKAPELSLLTYDDEPVSLYSAPSEKYSVLYFYDTGCAKCKLENIRLTEAFKDKAYPIDFYAVYAGDHREQWKEYQDSKFNFEGVSVTHLWDPEIDSDFQRKYGVIQTPRMFLISPDGIILGRGLDTPSMEYLLEQELAAAEFQYGSPEAEELFDRLLGPEPSVYDIVEISDMLAASTIDKGNVKMFKQLVGDFLYYLAPKSRQAYRYGLNQHIDKYILSRPDIWNTEDDSLKIVGFARIMHDLVNKAPSGEKIAPIKVRGTLLKGGKEKSKNKKLSKLKGKVNYIIFHTTGCPVCAAEIEEARALSEAYGKINIFLVNIDEVMASSPSKATELFDAFDLSVLPHIVLTDENNIVRSCYVSLIDSRVMETYPLVGQVY